MSRPIIKRKEKKQTPVMVANAKDLGPAPWLVHSVVGPWLVGLGPAPWLVHSVVGPWLVGLWPSIVPPPHKIHIAQILPLPEPV